MSRVGITSEILDGKLSPRTSLPSDVVLIVSRATTGPSNQLYSVSNTETAKQIFGASSPIIQLMKHAYAGGADNVALYRIGGRAASIENLFGEYTTFRTTAASVNAGANLKVYAGPRNNDPETSIVIVYDGTKIVYSNSPGQEINLGAVSLDGFDSNEFPYVIGKLGSPVAFKDIVSKLKAKTIESFVGDDVTVIFTVSKTGAEVMQVIKTVSTTGTITTLKPVDDYNLVGKTLTLTTPLATGDVIQVAYSNPVDASDFDITYQKGEDNMGANLNKLYELYDTAFVDLEAYDIFSVVIEDLFGARNIASGDGPSEDRLTYVVRTESEDGFEYKWSNDRNIYQLLSDQGQTTTDVSLAALDTNGSPIIVTQYNEVDFAHRLATWAWKQSDIAHYVNGVIGPRGPRANYTIAINRWIGKSPTKDIYDKIIVNGEGLLGNRFMVGTTNQQAGFYATDTGYPDGDPIYDSSNVIVDIGKHLSIPILPVYMASDLYTATGASTRSAAAAYAGLLTQVSPGDSTTNILIPGVTPIFKLKANKIQALSDAGYVVFEEKTKGLTVYSGDLATSDASDYDYISTAISITYVLKSLRDVIDPYIGKGISASLMAALYNAVDVQLKSAITSGYINGYSFNLIGTDANSLKLPLSIKPKHELRTVNVMVSLSEQDLYSI